MDRRKECNKLVVQLQDFITEQTTRYGDVYVPPEHDNTYQLKQALRHLNDCQCNVLRAIDIAEFRDA